MIKRKKEKKKKENNNKGIEELINSLQTRYGEGSIMKLGDQKKIDTESISSGSFSLDIALGVGGLPRGRIVEIYGPESSGKCITQDSIVFSEWGMLPTGSFGDLSIPGFQKEETFLYSEHSYEKASHFYNDGERNTIKVETNFGFTIEGTPNHRIRVIDKKGNYLFRRLDELKKNDHVAIQRGQQFFGGGVDLGDYKYKKNKNDGNSKKFDPPSKLTKDLAFLMGYLIGDGTLTNRGLNKNSVQITVGDKEVENDIKNLCHRIFKEQPKITRDKRTKSTKRFMINNVRARDFLNYIGVGWWQAEDKEIPWSILTAPKEIVAAFLSALFESDGGFSGGTIEYCTKSPRLATQLQIALLNFGIIAKNKVRTVKGCKYHYFYIDGQRDKKLFLDEIGFRSSRKNNPLKKHTNQKRQFQTNTDSIPNIGDLVEQFFNRFSKEIRNTNRADWDIIYDYLPKPRGKGVGVTYPRLDKILNQFKEGRNFPEYQKLEGFKELGFFYDKIRSISKSRNSVVDFTIPKTATFFANGFVNHNTTLSLHAIAEAQKKGGKTAFIDAEHALDPEYAKKIGVKVNELIISQPDSGDEALNILEDIVRSGAVDVVVIDSVAALTPKEEIEGEMGDKHMGLQARLMSQALRKLTSVIGKSKTIVIFINQIRMKIGIIFGNPETTPGGRALKFYSSVRIDIRRKAQIKKDDEVIGNRIKVKVVKNKIAPPFKIAEFDILYGKGISYESDVLNTAIKYGVINRKGPSYKYNGKSIAVGFDNARCELQKDKKFLKEIMETTKEAIKEKAKALEED